MEDRLSQNRARLEPAVYQIRVQGHLGHQWTDWFGGLTISLEENGNTLLTSPVIDQAALHALLRHVRDLGATLLSVRRLPPCHPERRDARRPAAQAEHAPTPPTDAREDRNP